MTKTIFTCKSGFFSYTGNTTTGAVIRSGWYEATLPESQERAVRKALDKAEETPCGTVPEAIPSDVYQRGRHIFALYPNGTERQLT